MLKLTDPRMPALLGALFIAGCAAGASDDGTGMGGLMSTGGTGGFGIQGSTPPPGSSGASGPVATGSGGASNVSSGSGGTTTTPTGTGGSQVTAPGGSSSGSGGATSGTGGTTGASGSTGAAGAGKAGSSMTGTGGGAPAGPCTAMTGTSMSTDTGGYFSTGTMWKGYAFTAKGGAGTTITPDDFSTLTAGQALCACGTVKGTTDYSGTAMIGINLNQMAGAMDLGTVMPSGMGIGITVTGTGTTTMRLQIQGPMGATDAKQRWCANVPAGGGVIPWGNFQFECWEGGMRTPFDGMQPIAAAMALIPGGTTDIPFNFCVTAMTGG